LTVHTAIGFMVRNLLELFRGKTKAADNGR
jgi:hypothetical protein